MPTVNMPAPFPGSEAERNANRDSHAFDWQEGRCWNCDSRMFSTSADWPCGADVPRVDVTFESEEAAAAAVVPAWILVQSILQAGDEA